MEHLHPFSHPMSDMIFPARSELTALSIRWYEEPQRIMDFNDVAVLMLILDWTGAPDIVTW